MNRPIISNYAEFKEKITEQFWNKKIKDNLNAQLHSEWFVPGKGRRLEFHLAEIYEKSRYLDPPLSDEEFMAMVLRQLPYHYQSHWTGRHAEDLSTFREALLAYDQIDRLQNIQISSEQDKQRFTTEHRRMLTTQSQTVDHPQDLETTHMFARGILVAGATREKAIGGRGDDRSVVQTVTRPARMAQRDERTISEGKWNRMNRGLTGTISTEVTMRNVVQQCNQPRKLMHTEQLNVHYAAGQWIFFIIKNDWTQGYPHLYLHKLGARGVKIKAMLATTRASTLSEQDVRDQLQNLVGQRLKLAAERQRRYYKTSKQKTLKTGTLVFVRGANISNMCNFICAKLMPLYSGPSVVSGRKNENYYELTDPATGELQFTPIKTVSCTSYDRSLSTT
ncbi:hypothetical protein PR048_008482 [Dryococelus australis]|uniref:Uncharacterized protein n=1 Tax=Dryococelus australis TaxID=614101 RepID=A0ABQ9HX92_9NEOP|nr:hypothetical protein PR048_008482 [Dryococelus australis]